MEMTSPERLAPAHGENASAAPKAGRRVFATALKITTAMRLALGFGFVILLLLISFWIAAGRLGELNRMVEQIALGDWAKAGLAHEIVGRMNDNARATFELFHSAERTPLLARIERNRREIDQRLNLLEAQLSSTPDRALLDEARLKRAAFVASFGKVAAQLDAGQKAEAERVLKTETLPALDQAVAAFDALEHFHGTELERTAQAAMQAYHGGLGLLVGFVAAAWLAASLSAVWVIRRVTRPLGGEPEEATAIARRIASGDLAGEIRVRPGDETSLLAAMKLMQENMRDLFAVLNADSEEIEALNRDLEERVRQRTAELEAANRELESFGHAMAHDLQTPLRAQEGFSRLLLKEHASQMDADAQDCARRINAASQRMAQLLDDLLDLMNVSRADMRPAATDLSALAREAVGELRAADPQRRVEAIVQPGIVAQSDPAMMRIVMRNLLGNAWKFTRPREEARIEFGACEQDGQAAYFVRDNGVGFDPAHAGKLFQPFQRLVTLHQFEGSGIGLATVKRIVERHGGCIRVEAGPDKGATFHFTLPGVP